MIFYFIPFWVIALIIIAILAVLRVIALNIGTIILIGVVCIAILIFLIKWPKKTIIVLGLAFLSLPFIAMYQDYSINGNNDVMVTIYEATDECHFYNEKNQKKSIPAGAIVAMYEDEEIRSEEYVPDGKRTSKFYFSTQCSWYYNDKLYTSSVSKTHRDSVAEHYNLNIPLNEWNLKEIRTIRYNIYKKGNWYSIR